MHCSIKAARMQSKQNTTLQENKTKKLKREFNRDSRSLDVIFFLIFHSVIVKVFVEDVCIPIRVSLSSIFPAEILKFINNLK